MNFISTLKFSLKNIKSNRNLFLPYILSSSLMLSIMYIMSSLLSNEYIKQRHVQLSFIMGFGILLTFIFIVAFIVYINNFINKKRSREMSLYSILGLEKRHIVRIVFVEQLIIYIVIMMLSIIGGYVFGKISFMVLSNLIKDLDAKVTNYYFSFEAALIVLATLFFLFLVNMIMSIKRVHTSTPKEMNIESKKNEENLKFRKTFAIIGIVLLILGYYIALTTKGFMSSLGMFFIAVILVITGMYLFFIFSSTEILTALRKNKNIYYRKNNFFWISGMITRMKSNGASMATVTVLFTCILVALSSTITINKAMNERLSLDFPKEYKMFYRNSDLKNVTSNEMLESINKIIKESSLKGMKVGDSNIEISKEMMGYLENGNSLIMLERFTKDMYDKDKNIASVYIETLESYNQKHNKNLKLLDGEIMISKFGKRDFTAMKKMDVFGREYRIKNYEFTYNSGQVFKGINIVVKDLNSMKKMIYDALKDNSSSNTGINIGVEWNVEGIENRYNEYDQNLVKNIKKYKIEKGLYMSSKEGEKKSIYALNGGFIFMGGIVSIVFLIGIILVTYYKQVFEGYADRENIQIMKKVGLDDKLIKKTSSSQIFWFFLTPMIIAPINTLIASKMLYTLLTLFGLSLYSTFFIVMLKVFICVAIIYFILFKLTYRVYYKIVN